MASGTSTFSDQATQLRARIDQALQEFTQLNADCPPRLREAMRYSLLAGGKRLRPLLVLWSAEACGCDVEQALPAACAVEMIHTYSLIHDDLPAMDDDDLRRGRPTNHKQFDEATAVLAGDALLTLAFEILAKHIQPPAAAARCCAALAEAAGPCGMVAGQTADMYADQTGGDLAMLEGIHRRKTGALLRVSLELGAQVAGANDEQRAALATYGTRIGLAFQIIDDLLDVEGDEQSLGKRVGKDHDSGKLTFPGLLGIEESRRRAAQLINEACDALVPFGSTADRLSELARYIVERDR